MQLLDGNYWNERYQHHQTQWDMGMVSPPLKAYADQLTNKATRILIPGGGNSYEAGYLWEQGFTNITVLDIAAAVTDQLKERFAATGIRVLEGDFFAHHETYELVLEQTFFCALDPLLRIDYVQHMSEMIVSGGKLTGVLFNRTFSHDGPPFGGNVTEYKELFSQDFELKVMEDCYNSHPARQGSEVFINFVRK
ncbi:SAM-dependent methyltransferase [Chitinophaga sp. Cy-1792]|uniref:SAM-dependent methyltransferase n=1 Tax=Chitinophaga sp. Cy-1792 TaxID=2608339 RepID=UPI001420D589|nr:SAM-dependent methyltransferase [Chitinophaga sp. Cy-1792]NIG53289.1 SAM-dependent methyltransferase [Chitinophaga sp. Cy-1792]